MRPLILSTLIAGFLATGCGFLQPGTAETRDRYQADAATCDKTASEAVNKRNAKRALAWFASPVTRWSQIDDGVSGCMQARGWGVNRPCTEEELRRGNQTSTLVVTARGITCKSPGRPS